MPNHVTNTLEIYIWHRDRKDLIDEVRALIGGTFWDDGTEKYIDFEKIIPPPDHPAYNSDGLTSEAKKAEPEYNWYDWNCNNWGTKWNAYCQSIIEQDADMLRIQFDTAWTHPAPVIARLREMLKEKYPEELGFDVGVNGAWLEEGYQSAGVF